MALLGGSDSVSYEVALSKQFPSAGQKFSYTALGSTHSKRMEKMSLDQLFPHCVLWETGFPKCFFERAFWSLKRVGNTSELTPSRNVHTKRLCEKFWGKECIHLTWWIQHFPTFLSKELVYFFVRIYLFFPTPDASCHFIKESNSCPMWVFKKTTLEFCPFTFYFSDIYNINNTLAQ